MPPNGNQRTGTGPHRAVNCGQVARRGSVARPRGKRFWLRHHPCACTCRAGPGHGGAGWWPIGQVAEHRADEMRM